MLGNELVTIVHRVRRRPLEYFRACKNVGGADGCAELN